MGGKDPERERRLAEALRENLRRRKAQARAAEGSERSEQGSPKSAGGEAGPLHQPPAGPPPRPGED